MKDIKKTKAKLDEKLMTGVTMKSFKLGDKVKTKDNHDYLNISKRMIGTVTNIFDKGTSTEAMFNKHKIIFVTQELKKVTKKNAKKKQK